MDPPATLNDHDSLPSCGWTWCWVAISSTPVCPQYFASRPINTIQTLLTGAETGTGQLFAISFSSLWTLVTLLLY